MLLEDKHAVIYGGGGRSEGHLPVTQEGVKFHFVSNESGSTFECCLDDADQFTSCDSGIAYSDLSEGSHTFEVRAKDGAGNIDATPATRSWTVDAIKEVRQPEGGAV